MNKNGIEKENENITLLGNIPKNLNEMGEQDHPTSNAVGGSSGFALDQDEDSGALKKRRSTPTRSFKF